MHLRNQNTGLIYSQNEGKDTGGYFGLFVGKFRPGHRPPHRRNHQYQDGGDHIRRDTQCQNRDFISVASNGHAQKAFGTCKGLPVPLSVDAEQRQMAAADIYKQDERGDTQPAQKRFLVGSFVHDTPSQQISDHITTWSPICVYLIPFSEKMRPIISHGFPGRLSQSYPSLRQTGLSCVSCRTGSWQQRPQPRRAEFPRPPYPSAFP